MRTPTFFLIFTVSFALYATPQRTRLLSIAQSCSQRALACQDQSSEQKRLDALSSACLEAHTILTKDGDQQACARLLAPFAPVRNNATVTVPLDAMAEMIEKEEVHLHLAATPLQLTSKRIIFRTFIELFYAFGMSKITLQQATRRALNPEDRPDRQEALTTNPLQRLKHYLHSELMFSRSQIGMRILRIGSNEMIDQLTPNPNAKRWQEYAELLIPIAIAHGISYLLLRNAGDSIKLLADGLAQEIIMRLFMVQFFLTKFNLKSVAVMLTIYALAFYNSNAGKRIWQTNGERPGESGLGQRIRYLKTICHSRENFTSVLVDAMGSLALYKIIDTGVSKLKLPSWMLLTPVRHQCPQKEYEEHTEEVVA